MNKTDLKYSRSYNAHMRLYKKALFSSQTISNKISLCYHACCAGHMNAKKRVLTKQEKKLIYKYAKADAYGKLSFLQKDED